MTIEFPRSISQEQSQKFGLEHSRKLGIAEATLMTIAILAECEIDAKYGSASQTVAMQDTFKEIAKIARQALTKTGA